MPAEFFPLKLIFNRCAFSVPAMTVDWGYSSPGQEGGRPLTCGTAVGSVCVLSTDWIHGEDDDLVVYFFTSCYSLPLLPDSLMSIEKGL